MNIDVRPIPTGGAVMLDFQVNGLSTCEGPTTIERSPAPPAAAAWTTLWTGADEDMYVFLDANEGKPQALAGSYIYRVTDSNGPVITDPVTVTNDLTVIEPPMTALLSRLFEASIASVRLPPTITGRPTFLTAMPIGSLPVLPIIVINNDLFQQEDIPIGNDVAKINQDENLTTTFGGHAKSLWRVSIMTKNAAERDYWRNVILATFESLCNSVFAPIGQNISHSFQATNFQVVKEGNNDLPGFYGSDVLLDITGSWDVTLINHFGIINHITFTNTYLSLNTVEVEVPLDS